MGRRGECSREKAKDVILLFVADQKKHIRSEFVQELVTKRKEFAKNTIYKYLDELVTDELIKMEPGSRENSFRPDYSITKLGLEKANRVQFNNLTASLDIRWINPLRNLIDRILEEKKDPYWVFNEYCFVFMGEMPFAFTKVPGALDDHIAFERRLRNRYHQDIEKFSEEFFKTRAEDADTRAECLKAWEEEIGGTITEYYRKLKKKAEKMPFPQSMWTVMGYSEEEIEKMLDEDKKQRKKKEQR